jgi:hypothetical protein
MVGKYKDLTTALPAMIEVLGDKDSDVSKLMIVEMLELYYNCKACKSVKKAGCGNFRKVHKSKSRFRYQIECAIQIDGSSRDGQPENVCLILEMMALTMDS